MEENDRLYTDIQIFELLQNMSNPSLLIASDASIRFVNSAFEKLTGYALNEVIDNKIPYLFWPKSKDSEYSKNLEATLKGEGNKVEHLFVKKGGLPFWVESTSIFIKENGKIKYLVSNWIDISLHVIAQERLRRDIEKYFQGSQKDSFVLKDSITDDLPENAENRLQDFIDTIEDSTNIMDNDLNIIFQNKYSRNNQGNLLGQKCFESKDLEEVCPRCPVLLSFGDGLIHSSVSSLVLSNYQTIAFKNIASPIIDPDGRVLFVVEIGKDITEQRRMLEQLTRKKNGLELITEAMKDGLNILDLDYEMYVQWYNEG